MPAVELAVAVLALSTFRCGGAQRGSDATPLPTSELDVSSVATSRLDECTSSALRRTIGELTTDGSCAESGGERDEPITTGDYRLGSEYAPAHSVRLCAAVREGELRFVADPYSVAYGRDDGCSAHGGWYSRYHWKTLPSRGYFESMAAAELRSCLERATEQ